MLGVAYQGATSVLQSPDPVTLALAVRAQAVLEMDPPDHSDLRILGAFLSAPVRPTPVPMRCLCGEPALHHRLRGDTPVCCVHWQRLIAHLTGGQFADLRAEMTRCYLRRHGLAEVPR